jgi:hypothetical protein
VALSLGSGYTDISIAQVPFTTSINILPWVQEFNILILKEIFTTLIYTVVASSPFNPIPEIQLSAELEQLRVNVSGTGQNNFSDNFWNTGLFHRRGIPYRKCNIGCTLQCFIQR